MSSLAQKSISMSSKEYLFTVSNGTATTVWLLEFIQLSISHSLTKYWNFCFTEFSKLNTLTHMC